MRKTKKNVKVRDLKPKKDAKGGALGLNIGQKVDSTHHAISTGNKVNTGNKMG